MARNKHSDGDIKKAAANMVVEILEKVIKELRVSEIGTLAAGGFECKTDFLCSGTYDCTQTFTTLTSPGEFTTAIS